MSNKMKTLCLDIETSPNKAYIWGLWQEVKSTDFVIDNWFILCWYAKWLNKKEMLSGSVFESSTYKKDSENDKESLLKLRDLLDEADVVIAHNGIKFDCKKINTRFLLNNITPPSPYKIVDTLIVARQQFAFISNRLNDLGQFLNLGKKADTGGFKLWKNCLNGDKSAWKKMLNYCKQDVLLLEKIYLKLRPYVMHHPNVGVYNNVERACCPKCGNDKIHYRGYCYTNVSAFRRFKCMNCGAWGRERTNILDKEVRKVLTTNIS